MICRTAWGRQIRAPPGAMTAHGTNWRSPLATTSHGRWHKFQLHGIRRGGVAPRRSDSSTDARLQFSPRFRCRAGDRPRQGQARLPARYGVDSGYRRGHRRTRQSTAGLRGKKCEITGNSFYGFNAFQLPPLKLFAVLRFLVETAGPSREAFFGMLVRPVGHGIVEEYFRIPTFLGYPSISTTLHR